ncbi:hypothetical protein TNCV_754071 [Trichonephila clavipes]|uniref:Uncharacterized protein n=2 Tax=Trichonephila TaxID=2585208 RepID=A0A8X6FRG0_TRICU|nr:hypothetical protein TNCT_476501 [Trichonephila clavata]GFV28864.1 hypothetical protein TNCV_754071 [Trichonephila clavipes]GFY46134.1 hypothetical protein TNIN_367841 [Trichonephila inaurata madagascariensis]
MASASDDPEEEERAYKERRREMRFPGRIKQCSYAGEELITHVAFSFISFRQQSIAIRILLLVSADVILLGGRHH